MFKTILWIVFSLVLTTVVALAFIYLAPVPVYEVAPQALQVNATQQRVAEGKRIAMMMCIHCHYNQETNSLAGSMISNPKEVEDNYASNITQDSLTGIGKYTDGELAYMLRTGINRKGRFVYDMPKYPLLSDEDLASIIAFLRSDDTLVRAVEKSFAPPPYNLLIKVSLRTILKPEKFSTQRIAHPDTNDVMAFGKYLCTAKFSCFACHSNDFIGNTHWSNPEQSNDYFKGGARHTDADHNYLFTANLSQDKEKGIGNWTEQQFRKTVKEGIKPDGTTVHDPMFPFYLLSDREVSAIFTYLKTIKP